MAKLQNFSTPVPAESLSAAELIVTMALILRGNYTGKKNYISVSGAKNPGAAIKMLSDACLELNIPFKRIPSDSRENYYVWSTNLDLVLAKQQMLPDRLKWRIVLHIPDFWIGHIDCEKLKMLKALTECISKSKIVRDKDTGKSYTASFIPDALNLNKSICDLFRPVSPTIKAQFYSSFGKYCIIEPEDNISDLL